MKFRKLGQALLALAVSTGIMLGVTSCANDFTVGYVYVTGTQPNGGIGGQIGGYKEDNNNGRLRSVPGSPFTSGGSNPVRAVITSNGRFLFVLNAGVRTEDASGNLTYPGGNISVFTIGGYGQLTFQHSYLSQGLGSIRLAADASGTHLFVLDSYSPIGNSSGALQTVSTTQTDAFPCQESPGVFRAAGDVTVFTIDTSTGRLDLVTNQQQQNLTYFPVGCSPVDFHTNGQYLFAMDAGSITNNDVETIYTYAVSGSSGQLTQTQTGLQRPAPDDPNSRIASITGGGNYIYLVDSGDNVIRPYNVGNLGALATVSAGASANTSSVAGNPQQLISVVGAGTTYVYVANAGPGVGINTASSDISGYAVDANTGHLDNPSFMSPYLGAPSGLVCIFEDPSNQYIYAAGSQDNTIAVRRFTPQTGSLVVPTGGSAFPTVGTPSWCLATSASR